MTRRQLSTVDSLAQYMLVTRLAALALTVAALGPKEVDNPWLVLPSAVLLVFNYLALRHWPFVITALRVADKPYYLALDGALSATILAIVGAGAPLVLYLVGTVALAGLVYSRLPTLVTQLTVFAVFELVHWTRIGYLPGGNDIHTLITLPALLLGGGFAGAAVRRLVTQNEWAAEQIGALQAQAAVHEERLRVARDLHDTVTKNLHGVWLVARGLESALVRGNMATARAAANAVAMAAAELAAQSRGVITGLREHDHDQPLGTALNDVVRHTMAGHPLHVHVDGNDSPAMTSPVRHEVLAIVSEALHNVVQHSHAHHVDVLTSTDGGALRVVVADDGKGFSNGSKAGHYGLTGMYERAESIGGHLSVSSRPGAGTRVELRVPTSEPPVLARSTRSGELHERAAS